VGGGTPCWVRNLFLWNWNWNSIFLIISISIKIWIVYSRHISDPIDQFRIPYDRYSKFLMPGRRVGIESRLEPIFQLWSSPLIGRYFVGNHHVTVTLGWNWISGATHTQSPGRQYSLNSCVSASVLPIIREKIHRAAWILCPRLDMTFANQVSVIW